MDATTMRTASSASCSHTLHRRALQTRTLPSRPAPQTVEVACCSSPTSTPPSQHAFRQHALRQHRRLPCVASALPDSAAEALAVLAESPNRDLFCLAVTVFGSVLWVKIFDLLAARGFVDQKLSRKLVHTTTGPIFAVTWALFSMDPRARLIAAIAPSLNLLRLVCVATGVVRDDGLVASVSRSGDRMELLKGPSYYCVVLIAACILCWRDNPAGLVAVGLMCGGDGLADIVGRRLGYLGHLPYNPAKSYAGSIAMFLGGTTFSYGLIGAFAAMGFINGLDLATLLPPLLFVAACATLVESLPINTWLDDNLSVPVVAWGLSLLLLPTPLVSMVASAAPVLQSMGLLAHAP